MTSGNPDLTLKPCPFCGTQGEAIRRGELAWCPNEDCPLDSAFKLTSWNRREQSAEVRRFVAAAERFRERIRREADPLDPPNQEVKEFDEAIHPFLTEAGGEGIR